MLIVTGYCTSRATPCPSEPLPQSPQVLAKTRAARVPVRCPAMTHHSGPAAAGNSCRATGKKRHRWLRFRKRATDGGKQGVEKTERKTSPYGNGPGEGNGGGRSGIAAA